MSLLAFIIGMGVASTVGCLTLILIEGRHQILGKTERIAWGCILGPTLLTFFFFLLYTADLILFTRLSLSVSAVLLLLILIGIAWYRKLLHAPRFVKPHLELPQKKWMKIVLVLIIVWSAMKILAGSLDLLTTPTYWDDAFNNWNMRAKVFVETQELALELPGGNDITVTKEGVNSYPPSVPLMKAWLTILRGEWSEGLANSIHAVWYIALLVSFFFLLRRNENTAVSIIGTYALTSLPLLLIQGLNPYADVYVAGHLLLAVGALWRAAEEHESYAIKTWLLLSACVMTAAVFTKNEVLLVFLPVYILLFAWTLLRHGHAHRISLKQLIQTVITILMMAIVLIAPWLWFKWANGLTFGNAKSVSELAIGITVQTQAAFYAIWYFLTREANFLFLPLAFLFVFIFSLKRSLLQPIGILALFVLIAFFGQAMIYLLTPLATEATNQTGLGRGLVQLAPLAMLFTVIQGKKLIGKGSIDD